MAPDPARVDDNDANGFCWESSRTGAGEDPERRTGGERRVIQLILNSKRVTTSNVSVGMVMNMVPMVMWPQARLSECVKIMSCTHLWVRGKSSFL